MRVGNLIEVSEHGSGVITSINWCNTDKEYQATIFLIKDARYIFISNNSLDWI